MQKAILATRLSSILESIHKRMGKPLHTLPVFDRLSRSRTEAFQYCSISALRKRTSIRILLTLLPYPTSLNN